MTLEAGYSAPTSYSISDSVSLPTIPIMMNTAPYGSQIADSHVEELEQDYTLIIRQQPKHARVALGKEKDRKPIDPPPIVQLKRSLRRDPAQNFLHSPYYFMTCRLIRGSDDQTEDPSTKSMIGTLVSSLHRLRDSDNQDGGFFVFGDLSVREEGTFRLEFSLFDLRNEFYDNIGRAITAPFTVHPAKSFPGMAESTFLTRSFSDQGVRLRLRKDSRTMTTRKRNHQHAEVARKHSDWDTKQEPDPSRQNSIIEGQVTPTERNMGSFSSSSGYYEPSSHRGQYGDSYQADPSYYGSDGPAKRMRYSMSAGEVTQSPTYMASHDMGQGFVAGRPAFGSEAAGDPTLKRMRHSMPGPGGDASHSPTYLGSRHQSITGSEVTQSPTYMAARHPSMPAGEVSQSVGYPSAAYISPHDMGHSYGPPPPRPGFAPDAAGAPASSLPLPPPATTAAAVAVSAPLTQDLTHYSGAPRPSYATDPGGVPVSVALPPATTAVAAAAAPPPLSHVSMSHAYAHHPSYAPPRINTQLGSQDVKGWW